LQVALQQLIERDNAQFYSKQHIALQAVMNNKSSIVLMMTTEAGKSLVFMLPMLVKDVEMTVVVTSLIVLKQDM
jgi:superfamily II DNA helicase RecQ